MICVHPLLYSLQGGAVPVQTPTKTLLPSLKVTVLPSDDTNSRLMAACSEYPSQYSRKSKQGFGIPTHRCVEKKLVIVRSKSLQSMCPTSSFRCTVSHVWMDASVSATERKLSLS